MATQPNWWESDPVIAPANDPGFSGYIPGVPKVKDPKDPPTSWQTLDSGAAKSLGLDTGFTWQRSSTGEIKKVGDAGDTGKDALGEAIKGLGIDELVTNVKSARSALQGGYATGITGSLLSHVPGTEARDFRGYINAIQGGVILEKLQALKEASKTGASGMGALSEKEGERLAASVASLDPGMSDEALSKSLDAIQQHANFLKAVADGKDPRDPNVAKQYGIGALQTSPAATPMGEGGPPPPGVSSLSDEQKHAYGAFLAANPHPDGSQVGAFLSKLTGRTVTNGDAIAKALSQGGRASMTVEDLSEQQRVKNKIAAEDKLGLRENPAETLVRQGATLNLSDEAAGIGNAAANVLTSPFTGKFDPVGSYQVGRDVERQRITDARGTMGWAAAPIEFAGGMAAAAPTSALAALTDLPGLVRQGATGGAVGGALAGFGAGEGAQQSLSGAGLGATGGAIVGALAPYAGDRVMNRNAPRGMAPDVAAAAQAENVDLLRPMVDPHAVSDYGALESNVYSQPIIRGAAARVRGQIEGRVADLGAGGAPLEPGAAGERLQIAGNRYITRSKGIKDRLYKRAEQTAGDTRFVPQNAIDQIKADIQELAGNPKGNAGTIQFLQDKLSDLSTPGGKTVAEIRNIREGLRGEIGSKNLTMTNAERLANNALHAAGDDIAKAAPEAGRLYKRADSFYRERQVMVDDLKKAIIGSPKDPLDPQKAFSNIKTLMGESGNHRRLSAVMSHLEPDERQDIAATVAENLGRRATDEPFSTALFLSQTRKLSPSARRTLFGADGAQSVENLRLLSRKLEEAGKDINQSRSATVLERQGWRNAARAFISGIAGIGGTAATNSLAGGAAAVAAAGAAMGASAARRVLSARAMVNPRVAMWLAKTADVSSPSQAKDAVRGLSLVISREPALAHELTPIRDFLDQRVTQLLAAEPGADGQDQEQR